MKKLSILFLSVLTIGLISASCSSNDDNGNNDNSDKEALIVGNWELTKQGNILNGVQLLLPITKEGGCNNDVITYLENEKYTELQYEYENSKCKTYNNDGTWSKTDKILTSKDILGNITTYEILELSNTTLRLKRTKGNETSMYTLSEYIRK